MIVSRVSGTEVGMTCVECKNKEADFKVILGANSRRRIPAQAIFLCKECAWNLSECLDDTTNIDFSESEK